MATERNNYEMPNNEDYEDLLQENLKTIKPLELKEKEVGGHKQLFPFWNVVEPEEVHYTPESYLSAKQKKERSMKGEGNLVDRMEDVMGKMKNTQMVDMTDAVKPLKNDLSATASAKQVTEWDATAEMQTDVKSNADKPKKDNVGAVKPTEADMGKTATTKQVTEWDSTKAMDSVVKSDAATPPKDNVGAVKPKEADMSATATTKQVTEWDSTKVDTPKKSKSKLAEPYGGIDFSKFM